MALDPIQVEANMKQAEAAYDKAVGRFNMNDLDEALVHLRNALALHPSNPKYHYNIAVVYTQKLLPEAAVTHYKLFLKYSLDDEPDIAVVKGRIRFFEDEIKRKNRPK